MNDWGAAKVREVIETQYLKRPLLDGPAPAAYAWRRDHVGVHDQSDGRKYVGAAPTVGRVSGTVLHRIGDLADQYEHLEAVPVGEDPALEPFRFPVQYVVRPQTDEHTGELPVRATRSRRREGPGTVHLVGGGPGDDGLITVRGRRLLATADVVVVDRLAPRGLLERLADDVEVIDCGKTPGHHQLTQDQINAVLVERALQGYDVVRLKGGDPFVLGRGGEEALACHAAGVPVEVVPGVTSAVSVPAAAGIPVTHRGIASSFALVSAHDGVGAVELAASEHPTTTTLVLLMGVRLLRDSAAALVTAGRAASTPVAIVEGGWTPRQRTTVGTLADIADLAEARAVGSPAVLVVGDVVTMRTQLGAFAPERP